MGHTVAHPILTDGTSIARLLAERDRARDIAALLEEQLTAVTDAAEALLAEIPLDDVIDGTVPLSVYRRCRALAAVVWPEETDR